MSLSKEQLLDLMLFADGELEGAGDREKKEALLALIETDADARAFVNAELPQLGAFVELAEPLAVPGLDDFDVADAVMAKIESATAVLEAHAPAPKRMDLKSEVVSLEAAREKRRRIGVFVGTAIALAAGIALVVRTHPAEEHQASSRLAAKTVDAIATAAPSPNSPPASSEASQAVANADIGVADRAETSGVEVNVASDSPQNGVSVFYLPGSNATAASAVVWIDDSQGGKN